MQHNLAFRPKEMTNDAAATTTSERVTAPVTHQFQLSAEEYHPYPLDPSLSEISHFPPTPPNTPPDTSLDTPSPSRHPSQPRAQPTTSQITHLGNSFNHITLRTLPTLAGGVPCHSEDLPCPEGLKHILNSIDFYFMQQVDMVWPGNLEEMHDVWTLLCIDVADLVNTVGMEAAGRLVDSALGEEWRRRAEYSG